MNDIPRQISRRGFLGAAGGVAALVGLSACAGTGSPGTPQDERRWRQRATPSTSGATTPATSKEVEQKIITAFQAANPGLTVKLIDAGKNYEEVAQKFNAALAGGDAARRRRRLGRHVVQLRAQQAVAPLDDLLSAADVETDDYVDSLYNDYKFNDKHYALPYARSTPLFYYNKDLWKAAGLEDRGPKTWEEFSEWAPKLKAAAGADKSVFELPDGSNYLDWDFQNMVWDFGGTYSKEWTPTFTDPKTVAAGTVPAGLRQGRLRQAVNKTRQADFASRHRRPASSLSTGSLGGITKAAKFSVGTAFLPGDGNCPTGGAGVAIPASISDERKKNALKFMEFLTNAENTVIFTQATGYMPVRKSAVDEPAEKEFLAKNPQRQDGGRPAAEDPVAGLRARVRARRRRPHRQGPRPDRPGPTSRQTFAGLNTETQQIIDRQIKAKLPDAPWRRSTSTRRHRIASREADAPGRRPRRRSTSRTASSSSSSARRAAASRRRCGCSPGSSRSTAAASSSTDTTRRACRPRDRDVAMVFQSYALYPNMTAAREHGVRPEQRRRSSKSETKQRVAEAATILELEQLLDRKPAQMSGGQRQRVAMGRAIVRNPKVFCMDEPLSNLDAKLRVSTRSQIAGLQRRLGITTVYVTHDQVEAMTMGHRVAVLRDGGSSRSTRRSELYDHPVNTFVASFIGSPAITLVESEVREGVADVHGVAVPARPGRGRPAGERVVVGLRPESWHVADARCGQRRRPQGRARRVARFGVVRLRRPGRGRGGGRAPAAAGHRPLRQAGPAGGRRGRPGRPGPQRGPRLLGRDGGAAHVGLTLTGHALGERPWLEHTSRRSAHGIPCAERRTMR